jgi:hypothetical protein
LLLRRSHRMGYQRVYSSTVGHAKLFKCYKYSHTTRTCSAIETCGFCASQEHKTNECLRQTSSAEHKCTLCEKNHPAWSPRCEIRKRELEKAVEARKEVEINLWFHEEPTTKSLSEAGIQISSQTDFPQLSRQPPTATLAASTRASS